MGDEKNFSYEIRYLAPAQRDLKRLLAFLLDNEVPEARAHEITLDIVKKVRTLRSNPLLGYSIGGRYGFETSYRGLVCGKYIAIYEVQESADQIGGYIEIRRIYHNRENYIVHLQSSN